MFKAEIMHMIDLDNSKLNHKSISGGRATHSFNHIIFVLVKYIFV
jgi:hypothetical protein